MRKNIGCILTKLSGRMGNQRRGNVEVGSGNQTLDRYFQMRGLWGLFLFFVFVMHAIFSL